MAGLISVSATANRLNQWWSTFFSNPCELLSFFLSLSPS